MTAIPYLSLALWAAVLVSFAPEAYHYVRGRYSLLGSYRMALFFVALLWIGGVARLIFLPNAQDVRMIILAMSCALAVFLLILASHGRVGRS